MEKCDACQGVGASIQSVNHSDDCPFVEDLRDSALQDFKGVIENSELLSTHIKYISLGLDASYLSDLAKMAIDWQLEKRSPLESSESKPKAISLNC